MALSGRLDHLTSKHRVLEEQLSRAMTQPSLCDSEIARLKREKLKIKDEIQRLSGSHTSH